MDMNDDADDDIDIDDEKLNAAFDTLGDDDDLNMLGHDDTQFSTDEIALFAEFEREGLDVPDPAELAALQARVRTMEEEVVSLKRQAMKANQQKNKARAVELLRMAKVLEVKLAEPREELEMMMEAAQRAGVPTDNENKGDEEGDLGDLLDFTAPAPRGGGGGGGGSKKVPTASVSAESERVKAGSSSSTSTSSKNAKTAPVGSSKPVASKTPASVIPAYSSSQRGSNSSSSSSCSSVVSDLTDCTYAPLSVNVHLFRHLEAAINEALRLYLADATRLKDSDKAAATRRFAQYKAMKDELVVLQSRKALPYEVTATPSFSWRTTALKKFVQDLTLADTELKIDIESVSTRFRPEWNMLLIVSFLFDA